MKLRSLFSTLLLAGMLVAILLTPAFSQSYVSEAQSNGFTLKKVVSDTAIATGQNFSYTIYFSIPVGATSVTITDVLPGSLAFQSVTVTSACGSPVVTSPPVNTMGGTVTLAWASVPGGCSGSFVITVNFPNGITCNNTTARNRVCMEGNVGPLKADFCTGFVSTRAIAVDPWTIGKWVIGAGTQPGPCSYVTADSVVTYQICVWKAVGTTGQLNLDLAAVTDTLPPGAVLVPASSSCGMTQVGNVIYWSLGSLSALSMYNTQCCTFKVLYPTLLFPTGTQIKNQATLTGTLGSANNPCGLAKHISNQTCVEVKPYISAFFSKYAYTNGQPGCAGKYQVWVCNNGSLPISSLTITDTIPASLTGISLGAVSSGLNATLTGNIVTVTLTAPLLTTQCRYFEVNFTIPSTATVGSTITNCAWLTIPGNAPVQACAAFTVNAPAPTPCLWKEVCSKQPSYLPGSIFRYRLRVQNIGGLPITGASITDVLNPNLQYIGNPSYYTSTVWNAPCQPTSNWPGVGFSQAGNTLTFTLPTIPATCQNLFYNACGMYGTAGVPFYFIEFDVKVTDTTALGNIPNLFTIGGGSLTGTTTSNTDLVNVIGTSGYFLDKSVSKDTTNWTSSTTAPAGSNVNYRLRLTVAPGSVGLRHITFADLLPLDNGAADNLILGPCTPRNSIFNLSYASPILSIPPATGYNNSTLGFGAVNNFAPAGAPGTMFVGGCGTLGTWAGGIGAGNENLGYYFGATPVGAGNSATAEFAVTVPAGAQPPDSACNTFAANAAVRHLINSTIISDQQIGQLESQTACVEVEQDDCIHLQPKSIVSNGMDSTGQCTYTIIVTATNPGAPVTGWFESYQGTVVPATMTIPSGTSTDTLTFIDTPPPDIFICIRYGIFDAVGLKTLCDSLCFDLPPCGQGGACDSLAIQLKSVTSVGVDTSGNCIYSVDLSVTNSGVSPVTAWFESFQGTVTPSFVTLPSGASTQTFTFTDTPPANGFICIRFGILANGLRIVCDSVCFDLPPCGGQSHLCDSLAIQLKSVTSTGTDAVGNCTYSVDLSVNNTSSSPIAAWFDSFQGTVTPASLSLPVGSSTQTFTFTDTPPADIFVCIRFGIFVGGAKVVCDSVCFDLPPCGGHGNLCDSIAVQPKSITSTGVNTSGNCTYSVSLSVNNASSSAITAWFDSFQGTVAPPTLSLPVGPSTQTLTFTDTPPTNTFICIRYGIFVNGQKLVCDSVCFDLPPCASKCDTLMKGSLDTTCCEYDVTIANVVGSPITSISYTLIGGTVNSITTLPCAPVTPAPTGSTSGILTYSPPCAGNMNFGIQATPTTLSNTVIVQIVVHHGQDSCVLRFEYTCDPTPLKRCDEIKAVPYHVKGALMSGRTFTVTNLKVPASPITYIDIVPTPTPCILQGSALLVDFVSTTWTVPFTRIPVSGFISANLQVKFNLAIAYSCAWTGTVAVIVHHADGDSCVYRYGPWKASPPVIGDGVILTDKIDKKLFANKLRLRNNSPTNPVKWISINVEDDEDIIVAGSGAHWNGTQLEAGYAELDGYEQGMDAALFSLERAVAPGATSEYFNLVVARDSSKGDPPVIRWTSYGENGDAIATDTVRITTPVLSVRGSGGNALPSDIELLQFFPNPSNQTSTVNYLTGRSMDIRLELYNQAGEYLDTIEEGFKPQGLHTIRFNTASLPAGNYYVRLSSDRSQVIKPLVIMR